MKTFASILLFLVALAVAPFVAQHLACEPARAGITIYDSEGTRKREHVATFICVNTTAEWRAYACYATTDPQAWVLAPGAAREVRVLGVTVLSEPIAAPSGYGWTPAQRFDADNDGDVDVADMQAFQACFNGPNRPPACE